MGGFVRLKSGVVVPEAAFAEAMPSRPAFGEVATTQDGRDITRGHVDALPLLPPTDSVLHLKGGGDIRLYDEVLRDDQVSSCVQQRKLALIARESQVEAADGSRRARKAADHLEEVLQRIGWDERTKKMLAGVFYGYAVAEIIWATDGAMITIEAIKVRNRRRFGWAPDGSLRLLTSSAPQGEPVPDAKFWAFATGADDDDEPYGLGLAHWLYWPVFFKRSGVKFWLVFLEKFGQPTAVGKYPPNSSQSEKDDLLEALLAIQKDTGIRIPEGMQIELLEAARSGTADYTALYDRMNQAISKVTIGHTGSTDSTPGRLGGEDMADQVREDIIKADCDLVCESFNCTVARWLTHFNDPQAPPPRVWRRIEDQPDLKSQAERDKTIFDMGFRPVLKYIGETYGGEWVDVGSQQPAQDGAQDSKPGGADGADGAEFADPCCGDFAEHVASRFPDQAALDASLDALTAEMLQGQMEDVLKPVLDLAETAPDQLLGRLAEIYPEMDDEGLQEQLQRLIFVAETWGRLNARSG